VQNTKRTEVIKKVRVNRRKEGRSSFETDHKYKLLDNEWFSSQSVGVLSFEFYENKCGLAELCSYRLLWHTFTAEKHRYCSQDYSWKENFQNLTHCSLFYTAGTYHTGQAVK